MNGRLPSQKQMALLEYIGAFIAEQNYSPSYREVMRALDYKSVSTVAKHIDGLIERGWLVKRENSKRSLEVVYRADSKTDCPALTAPSKQKLGEAELLKRLSDAKTSVEIGGRYVHYKGGTYRVEDLAITTDDDSVTVVYRAEYGETLLFVRPLSEWLETVDVEGNTVSRFARIDP